MQNNKITLNNAEILYKEESYLIRGACFEVYKNFRNTQKELVYQRALTEELKTKGLSIEREKQLPVYYLDKKVGSYVPDILVNGSILLELKAKSFLLKEDIQQFWYYLKNSEFKLGFLINFGQPDGVKIIRKVYDTARNSQRSSASGSA